MNLHHVQVYMAVTLNVRDDAIGTRGPSWKTSPPPALVFFLNVADMFQFFTLKNEKIVLALKNL